MQHIKSTKTEAAQAAETVVAKAKARSAKPEAAKPEATQASPEVVRDITADDEAFYAKLMARAEAIMAASWLRKLCAFAVSFTAGMGIAFIGDMLVTTLVTGALTLTGSAFIGTVLWVIGLMATIYACMRYGTVLGMMVLSGEADEVIGNAWGTVKGFFKRAPQAVAQ